MNKLWKNAIAELEEKGTNVAIIEEIKEGGINSKIVKVKDLESKDSYALKFYSNERNEAKIRQAREIAFLKLASNTRRTKTPFLKDFNLDDQWCLLQWIEGEKVSKLSKREIDQIVEFIKELNEPRIESISNKLPDAKDKLINLEQTLGIIQERLKYILQKEPINEIEIKYRKWIEGKLSPTIKRKSIDALKKNKKSIWSRRDFVVSPSDVGTHNMIKKGEKLYFIDFEYGGYDDICKLLSDWFIHPNGNLNKEEREYFLKLVEEANITNDNKWKERLYLVMPLFHLKWCLIMLKEYREGRGTENHLERIEDYFEKFRDLALR